MTTFKESVVELIVEQLNAVLFEIASQQQILDRCNAMIRESESNLTKLHEKKKQIDDYIEEARLKTAVESFNFQQKKNVWDKTGQMTSFFNKGHEMSEEEISRIKKLAGLD